MKANRSFTYGRDGVVRGLDGRILKWEEASKDDKEALVQAWIHQNDGQVSGERSGMALAANMLGSIAALIAAIWLGNGIGIVMASCWLVGTVVYHAAGRE